MKKYILSLIVFLLTTSLFAQEYSDKQIGFDQEKMTLKLQKRGLAGDKLNQEISDIRNYKKKEYLEQKKQELEKIDSIHKQQYNESIKLNRTVAVVPPTERAALIALYNSANGANWYNSNPSLQWLINDSTSDVSLWAGVTVVNNHVEGLNIWGMNGFIPDLSSLGFIKTISFKFNSFSGNLTGVQSLISLQTLALANQGSTISNDPFSLIPICSLLNLQEIIISHFIFDSSSLPTQMSNLTNLKKLTLYSPSIQNITAIGTIPTLTHIRLIFPNFSGALPSNFTNLSNLKVIIFQSSNVSNVDVLSNLPFIEVFDFSDNDLTAVPLNFNNLINLKIISLHNNNISGSIPSYFSNFSLKQLFIHKNNLEGLLPQINFSNAIYQYQFYDFGLTLSPTSRYLGLSDNKFRFNDLEANFQSANNSGIPIDGNFFYMKQGKTDTVENLSVVAGSSITLKMSDDALNGGSYLRYTANDTFQWFKGTYPSGVAINSTSSTLNRQLTLTNVTTTDAGNYYCLSRHPQITVHPSNLAGYNLVLERNQITLTVTPAMPCITSSIGTLTKTSPNGLCATKAINFNLALNTTSTAAVTYVWSIWNAAGTTQIGSSTTLTGTAAAGSSFSNTFATAGTYTVRVVATQDGCTAVTFNTTTIISANVTPTFTQVAPICTGSTLAALPTTSNNGITGTWSPTLNNTATTLYTFTPTVGLCANTKTMTITVNQRVNPTFTQVAAICSGSTMAALPTTSNNGITGSWSPPLNNTATTTYTFTPTPGLCANTKTMTITVKPNVTPTFTQVTPKCAGTTLAALPTTSTNGVTGTWSPALNNTTTTTYTFTPTAGSCVIGTGIVTMTITIIPKVTPTFTQVTPRCSGTSLTGLLPTTSTNGITGTWSPALNNTTTTTYTFTPTAGSCVIGTGIVTMTITILPKVTPTFTQVTPRCSGSSLTGLLPTTSNNGITGTWSPALNNTTTTTYTFTPTAGSCVIGTGIVTMTITITPNVIPTFTQIAPICSGETLAPLPTTSTNGVIGTWLPALNNTVTTTYTFTPTAGLCATTQTMTITVNPLIAPTLNPVTNITPTSATISWSQTGNVSSWNLLVQPIYSGFPQLFVPISIPNTQTSYTITGLTPGVQYEYYLQAVCSPTQSSNWVNAPIYNSTQTSCTVTNQNTAFVKQKFINFMNTLLEDYNTWGATYITPSYTSAQFELIKPYITDANAGIYNFSNADGTISFSFSNHPNSTFPDVVLAYNSSNEYISNFDLSNYQNADVYVMNNFSLGNQLQFTTGQVSKDFKCKHINFCPAGICLPTNAKINILNADDCLGTSFSFMLGPSAPMEISPVLNFNWIVTLNNTTVHTSNQSSFNYTPLAAGDYTVTLNVTGIPGCERSFTKTFTVNQCSGCAFEGTVGNTVKGKFIALLNQIIADAPTTTIDQNYATNSTYFAALAPHISDQNPSIYNFSYVNNILKFSFSNHPDLSTPDVYIGLYVNSYGLITDFSLSTYTSAENYLGGSITPGVGLVTQYGVTKPFNVKHIDFCNAINSPCIENATLNILSEEICFGGQVQFNVSANNPISSSAQYNWTLLFLNMNNGTWQTTNVSSSSISNPSFFIPYQGKYKIICTITVPGCDPIIVSDSFETNCGQSCTVDNQYSENIKNKFISFINEIIVTAGSAVPVTIDNALVQTWNSFIELKPYITDNNPGFYNFIFPGTDCDMSFSFSDHGNSSPYEQDVYIHEAFNLPCAPETYVGFGSNLGLLQNFNLTNYASPEYYWGGMYNSNSLIYENGQAKSFKIRHVNFCSEPCKEITGDIKIVSKEICTNSPIDFTFLTNTNSSLTYNWTFTHIETETEYNTNNFSPSVILPFMGDYNVILIVTDALGCTTKFEYKFKIDKECPPCYKTNENSEYVKQRFIALINHLNNYTSLPNGYSCSQLDELVNNITDANPAIYNFSNTSGIMKFSFAQHPGYDVIIPISPSTQLTNIALGNYAWSEIQANITTYLSDGTSSGKGFLKHIDFCPSTICKPVKGSIDIKIDKLCTATELPFIFNTEYDTSLLEYYWSFNYLDPQTQQYTSLYSNNTAEPIVLLPYLGVYEVVLTIIDENECVTIIRKKFEIVNDCKKCFESNPGIEENAKQAFISLLNHLVSAPASSINYGYTCSELSNLSSYITDASPAIYNFTNTGSRIKFAFSDHGVGEYDVDVPITSSNLVNNINLNDFVWYNIFANIKLYYADASGEMGIVKHIDFCNKCKNINGEIIIKKDYENVCQGIMADFVFESPNSISNYNWNFYDANYNFIQSISSPTASVLFQNNGTYHVSIDVVDNENCKQTFYSTFVVATCPDTPIETDCKVHFNFNFKAPEKLFGGVLNNDERINIGNGVINFVNSKFGEQLYVTTYDDTKTWLINRARRTITQQNAISLYSPATTIGGDVTSDLLKIQDRNYNNTFSRIINSTATPLGIVPHPLISDINVSFFIISQDRYTSLAELQNAYNQLLSPNKADKIFFVLVKEGKFKDTSTNTFIDPVDFVNSVKGSTAVDYNFSGSFIDSDYIVYSKEQIADPSFVGQFSEFLNLAYKAIKPENCDISCTVNNPHTSQVKDMFRDLLIYLNSQPSTLAQGISCPQLDLLRPYITDTNANIWNFIKTDTSMSFSFANHPISEPDVFINFGTGDFGGIDLSNYVSSDAETLFKYNGNQTENNKVKHINFCPDELFCKHHVAIVVDESGSISETEAIKIRRQLKSFVEKQMKDNQQLGSNMHVSLIGMSDSDDITKNRTDAIIGNDRLLNNTNYNSYNSWITNYKKRYNLPMTDVRYSRGLSPSSDFWLSGLRKAKELTIQPDIVILITDGCETNDIDGSDLRNYMMQNFDNNGNDPSKPHLFVVGIENGYYVDEELAGRPALTRETDPNYADIIDDTAGEETDSQSQRDNADNAKIVSSTTENNSLTSETANRLTPFLKKSLKYLLGYTGNTEYPSIAENLKEPKFFNHDYIGLDDFRIFGSDGDPNYLSNGLIDKDSLGTTSISIGCGNILELSKCDECVGFQPIPEKEYILSAWVKEEQTIQVINYENAKIKLIFTNNADTENPSLGILDFTAKGEIIDGWQRIFKKFRIPENTVFMKIHLINDSNGTPVYFDDIRIHPADGSMKSFVYDPETFKLMSEMDENNYSTFYEYDKEGGLIRVKKETERGVKTIQETRSGNVIRQ